jgi:hypothetical protein
MYCALHCVCVRLSRSFDETVEVNVGFFTTTGYGAVGSGGEKKGAIFKQLKGAMRGDGSFEPF